MTAINSMAAVWIISAVWIMPPIKANVVIWIISTIWAMPAINAEIGDGHDGADPAPIFAPAKTMSAGVLTPKAY